MKQNMAKILLQELHCRNDSRFPFNRKHSEFPLPNGGFRAFPAITRRNFRYKSEHNGNWKMLI